MICPYCGHEHPDSITFCPTTGQKLTTDFCANCGAEIQPSWKICPKCGTPVHQPIATNISRTQEIELGTVQKRTSILIPVLFTTVVLVFIAFFIFSKPGILTSNTPSKVSQEINAVEGGKLILSSNTSVTIPPDSLQKNIQVSMQKTSAESAPALPEELVGAGSAYLIELGNEPLQQPVTLEIPFDPALLLKDVKPSQVFLSYYDENKKEWVFAGGQVDTSRNVIILETTHASWWMPTTWNWKAWIAVLNKTLQFSIVNWIEAAQLLTESCSQAGKYVQVDSSQARNVVQGCIEQDDAERPELRVVNPKSFFFEVQPVSGGNGYPEQTLLSPGEDLKFEASTSDPAPLIIEANMTQKSGWYLVVHMVLTMLPGANQFGIQGKQVACITERLADVSYFADAVEALLVDKNGAAAAESLSKFMLDGDAVRRFITAADDCNFGPAQTWSVEGMSQIGGAVSTIMSATDYIANYFAGNTTAQVSYIWVNPKPLSNKYNLWLLDNFDPECCVPSYKDTLNIFDGEGNRLKTISGLNFSQTVGGHRAIAVSPNGDYALVSDQGDYKTGRLSRYEISGDLTWTINQNIDSVVISRNGYAYALTSKGTIYGDRLLLIDPLTGQILKEVAQGGFDLVVDEAHNAVWLVGKDIKKLTLDYQLKFVITPIEWVAVSVDYASDGSVWVAERKHPDISGSRTRFFNVTPTGDILLSVELNSEPFCLRVDRNDNSIWLATNEGVYKFDKTGKQILKVNESNVWTISVNQEDESIWAASYSGIAHYSKNGDKLIILTDFSNDQKYIELPYELSAHGQTIAPNAPQIGVDDTGFPLPPDAYNITKTEDGGILFYTKYSLEDSMRFYRDQYTAKGYAERQSLTVVSGGTFSLVFDGDPSGKAVIVQSVDLGDGSRTIALRLDDV